MTRWPELSLLEVARLTRGTEPGSSSYTDASRGVRFLRVGDITGKTDNPVYTDSDQLVLVSANDILLTLDGSPGHVSTGQRGAISSGIRKVEPKEPNKISSDWLRYSLMSSSVQQTISQHTRGVTILHASSAVPHIRIPLPSLAEQKRIVRLLDEAKQLLRLRTEADKRTSKLIPALFHEMFGDPILNSKKFPIVMLGDIAKLERGRFTPRPRNDPSYFNGIYPFIQTGDISDSCGLLSTWRQTLNEHGRAVSKEFPAGTIVVAIVGATIGATAILQVPMYCTDSIIGIQVNPKYCFTEYVEFVLRLHRPLLMANAPDAARANLNLEILRNIQIPRPSRELQNKFVDQITKIRTFQEKQVTSQQQLNNLFQSILHRAFQGEL